MEQGEEKQAKIKRVASSIIPETMLLGQIDCNANPELTHHKIVLML